MSETENLLGMSAAAAKEYIAGFVMTVKLSEKKLAELSGQVSKWQGRIDLARSKGAADLAAEAQKQLDIVQGQRQSLLSEIADLKEQVAAMRKQLPGLAARERSIDQDLLEQELLMALGYMPGDEDKLELDRKFNEIEKSAGVDTELDNLKAAMGLK
ncbi:PspA/IM30 family protein [Breznakiellaceae bacterium SP9]